MKKKILVVDDDPNITELLSDYLTEYDYDTVVTNDSSTAIDLIKSTRPDLISMDLNMPKPDGLELLRKIKSIEEIKEIPILILSTVAIETERKDLLSQAQGVFPKPPNFKKFLETISDYCGQKTPA